MGITNVVQAVCDNCGRIAVGGDGGLNDIEPGWAFVNSETGERIPDKEVDADGFGMDLDLCLCPECEGKVQWDPEAEDRFVPIPGTVLWSVETEWDGGVSLVIHKPETGDVAVYAMFSDEDAQKLAYALRSALADGADINAVIASGTVSLRS